MKSLVSVIIPVYNAEKYLNKCLDSVLSQSYENIEVLLIDDGSTDRSGIICDEYAERDDRIKVFHKENGGVSSARNLGLDNFSGDFVCFVDADDYVTVDYVETMLNAIDTFDCVAIGLQEISGASGNVISSVLHKDEEFLDKETFIEHYMSDGILRLAFFGPYCKLHKKETVENVRFNEQMLSGEDIVFNLNCLAKINRIKVINYIGYYMIKHDQSATTASKLKYSPRSEHDYTLINQNIADARRELGVSEEWIKSADIWGAPSKFVIQVVNLYCEGTPYTKKEALQKIREIHADTVFIDNIKMNKWKDVSKMGKLSKICVTLNQPRITSLLCRVLMTKHYKKA